jgi:mRNA interferase RelE/StbE
MLFIRLANDPRPAGCKKLKGRDGYRIRVGDYRIIYQIIDHVLVVEVVALGHRKDIYN